MRSSRWFWMAMIVALLLPAGPMLPAASAGVDETPPLLSVEYLEFPPYYFTNKDMEPDGFLLKLAAEAFSKAGVQVAYESLSAGQILNHMRSERPVCSIGWFKTPEREAFARFSREIYRNRPLEVIYLKKNDSLFAEYRTLAELMRDRSLRFGAAKGYSLGRTVDAIIAESAPATEMVNGGYADLFRLLAAEGISYFLAASEHVDGQIRRNHLNPDLFASKQMADIPEGNKRYLMYSRGVPEAVIRRIDKALGEIVETP